MRSGGGPPSPVPRAPSTGTFNESGVETNQRPAKWLTITDAMEYLDAVKLEYRDQPDIYDDFLAIMGRFRTNQMLPPAVIDEVATLFRGRDQLILRFNRFLPDAYKIGQEDIERMEDARIAEEQRERRQGDAGHVLGGDTGARRGGRGTTGALDGLPGHLDDGGRGTPDHTDREDEDDVHDCEAPEYEFDHAINYVTCIKRRFAHEPETYKAFLDILHTYQRQREHTGINTVLEQVTSLFSNQPDLLKEFTYFLPDTVQAQAKEKLDRAAEEAEIRLGIRDADGRVHNGNRGQANRPHGGTRGGGMGLPRGTGGDMFRGGPERMSQRDDLAQDWHNQFGYIPFREGRHPRVGHRSRAHFTNGNLSRVGMRHPFPGMNDSAHGSIDGYRGGRRAGRWRGEEAEDYESSIDAPIGVPRKRSRTADQPIPKEVGPSESAMDSQDEFKVSPEHQFFDQARNYLCEGGDNSDWSAFLKVLEMFSNDVFSRDDMMVHARDLFGDEKDYGLLDKFKALVDRRDSLDKPPAEITPIVGLSDMHLENAPVVTPSYREIPRQYQLMRSSGRSAAEEKLLNDRWVSLPVGSEDNNTFKHMRRNPHEDVLFKVEDERFELDMLIDAVTATIARLEPAEEEIEALKATVQVSLGQTSQKIAGANEGKSSEAVARSVPQFQYRLDERTLGAIHLSTISRLYGDHGPEVLELMRENPAAAVPVVLKRLRQKQREWRTAREKAKSAWKELAQKNFHKSLDHRSSHFRREDRRSTTARFLVEEIKYKKAEEDPQAAAVAAVVKAARVQADDAQDDPALLIGRISPLSFGGESDNPSVSQNSVGGVDGGVTAALPSDGRASAKSPVAVPQSDDAPSAAEGRPRTREGIRALRRKAEETAPWYMFEHLSLSYPEEELESIHQDIMDLLVHTLARRPPSEEDAGKASPLVVDLLPTFFRMKTTNRRAVGADVSKAGKASPGVSGERIDSAEKEMPGMPTLSSDEDSDNDNDDSSPSTPSDGVGDTGGGPPQPGTHSRDSTGSSAGRMVDVVAKDPGVSLFALPDNQEIFLTTTDFYVALRMHHMLAGRLSAARRLCREAGRSRQPVVACSQEVLQASAGVDSSAAITGARSIQSQDNGQSAEVGYKTFLGHLFDLLEERISGDRYDEGVRQLVGNQGYVLGQLDKLVVGLLQNLCRASTDKVFVKLCDLYRYERTTQPDGVVPAKYRSDAERLLRRSDSEVVRAQYHPGATEAMGSQMVKPTLKMEYIGCVNAGAREEESHGGDCPAESIPHSVAGGTESNSPVTMMDTM